MNDKYRLPDGRERFLAHDVRHLTVCDACGEIGDDRTMIRHNTLGNYHGECAVQFLGDEILDLPWEEREKFTIGDVGVDLMKKLLAKRTEYGIDPWRRDDPYPGSKRGV